MNIKLTREEAQEILDALEEATNVMTWSGFPKAHNLLSSILTENTKNNQVQCTHIPPVTEDGWTEWQFPIHKGYLMQCCDCNLIHEVDFKVVRKISRIKKDGSWDGEPTKAGEFRVGMKMRRYK